MAWWKKAVFYQIYPRSFQDTNGDGIGDIPGIIARVDYLAWLGIDAVWLSPVYPSPMADFGYDIRDYTNVDPVFGTLDDLDRLFERLHANGIKLILDFVPNHTSDEHPWFVESRSSRTNPKRDWYVWRDPRPGGGVPNNWLSRFGGSAWTLDERTGQYFYHAFLERQPDLNWRNPEVRAAMAEVLRFWMRRGADGFRVDACAVLIEDDVLRDDPPNPDFDENTPPPSRLRRIFTDDRPESADCLAELRQVVDEFPGRVLAGEVQGDGRRIMRYYGYDQRPCLHLPLNYCLLEPAWNARSLQATIDRYLQAVPAGRWPDWAIGGHDKRRIASRIGSRQARIAGMLALTLPGTPFFFAGDEIGKRSTPIPPDRVRDPFERRVPGYGVGRDPERTPMQWDASRNAGFTTGEPWLPVDDEAPQCNVAALRQDPRSILTLYRRLLALRRQEPALAVGAYRPRANREDVLLYERRFGEVRFLIALNTSDSAGVLELGEAGAIALTSELDREGEPVENRTAIRPNEGLIIRLGRQPGGADAGDRSS